jgi:hypothetical protein
MSRMNYMLLWLMLSAGMSSWWLVEHRAFHRTADSGDTHSGSDQHPGTESDPWIQPEDENLASDLTLFRRLCLGLIGTIPSLEWIRTFESWPRETRLNNTLQLIFEDPRYGDYMAERFARAFVGVENGPFLVYRRRRLVDDLSESIQSNQTYDRIVRELITAQGVWTSHPEVNFLTATIDPNNDKEGPDEVKPFWGSGSIVFNVMTTCSGIVGNSRIFISWLPFSPGLKCR